MGEQTLTPEEAAALDASIKTVRAHLSRIGRHVKDGIPGHGAIEIKGAIRELAELQAMLQNAQDRILACEARKRATAEEARQKRAADPKYQRQVAAYLQGACKGEHVR
jgi:hypothetical protein